MTAEHARHWAYAEVAGALFFVSVVAGLSAAREVLRHGSLQAAILSSALFVALSSPLLLSAIKRASGLRDQQADPWRAVLVPVLSVAGAATLVAAAPMLVAL